MHYIGMSAIPVFPGISYDFRKVWVSIAIAVCASYAAQWLTFSLREMTHRYLWPARAGAAVIMGSAIAGMHYTGMAAITFPAGAYCRGGLALDDEWMGVSVGIATLALLSITLVIVIFDAHLASRARLHAQRLQRANSQLSHQARHDATTGLPTREAFLRNQQGAIDEAKLPDLATPLAVMLVDIDRFKIVNDSLGSRYPYW